MLFISLSLLGCHIGKHVFAYKCVNSAHLYKCNIILAVSDIRLLGINKKNVQSDIFLGQPLSHRFAYLFLHNVKMH